MINGKSNLNKSEVDIRSFIMVDYDMVSKALMFLQNNGWSDLIDRKWKKEVEKQLKENFDMDKETLKHVLDCVIF